MEFVKAKEDELTESYKDYKSFHSLVTKSFILYHLKHATIHDQEQNLSFAAHYLL